MPFNPARRLVVGGPYRFVRNPMAIGVALVLDGAGLYYPSTRLLGATALFLLIIHGIVVGVEEPVLRRLFCDEYGAYTRRVRLCWLRPFV